MMEEECGRESVSHCERIHRGRELIRDPPEVSIFFITVVFTVVLYGDTLYVSLLSGSGTHRTTFLGSKCASTPKTKTD